MSARVVLAANIHGALRFYSKGRGIPEWVPEWEAATIFDEAEGTSIRDELGGTLLHAPPLRVRRTVDGELRPGRENDHGRKT